MLLLILLIFILKISKIITHPFILRSFVGVISISGEQRTPSLYSAKQRCMIRIKKQDHYRVVTRIENSSIFI